MNFTGPIQDRHKQAQKQIENLNFGAYIGGENCPAGDGDTFKPTDPSVNEPITTVARCSSTEVNDAVGAANTAFGESWGAMDVGDRADLIRAWISKLQDHADELALLQTLEVGKPLTYARADIESGLDFFEYYANVSVAQEGEQVPTGADSHTYVRQEPYGVTGQILPWNYPIQLMGWKVGAALAAGNTTVIKPPSPAPLSVLRAAQLTEGILPDGVLNVVPGSGGDVGEPIVNHPDVQKVSFTGSVPVGQSIMRTAADTVTPVTLELGGKNPFIIFPDADIEEAAANAATGGMYNAGQSCDSATRILVHKDVKDKFVDAYLDELAGWEPGDPLQEETTMGPLAYEGHCQSVDDYVHVGREEGASVLSGGESPKGDEYADGAFYRPTVFDNVDPDMRIAQEEVFGPVQFLMTFSEYQEAIEIANGVEYGLTAGIATENPSVAHRAAADVEAGSVWINQYFGTVPGTPFGGFKKSGFGRECAQQALDEHMRSKSVSLALDEPPY